MFGKIKDHLVKAFEISPSVAYKLPDMEIFGDRKITIENYRSLLLFSETQIVLKLMKNKLQIMGNQLVIESYNRDGMVITGRIFSVSFVP